MLVESLWFLACAALIVIAGTVLTHSADAIAERTGLGRVFVGSLLLAGATSLPELSTDISAVMLGEPDLAVGDLLGSSVANMALLVFLTLLSGGRLLKGASASHLYTGLLAIGLTLAASALVLAGPTTTMLGVSPGSLLLAVCFLAGTRAAFRHGATRPSGTASAPLEASAESIGDRSSLGLAVTLFIAAAAVVLLAAPALASAAVRLADLSGLGTTFVGTWLLGATTSAPELVSGIVAVRMRAHDLALANLFGSNALNMVVFLPLDLVHSNGSIFTALSSAHAVTGLGAVVLMSFALFAMYRRR